MKNGYARVSTQDQNLNLQIDALKKVGCEKIYREKASGSKSYRIELISLLEHLRPGDLLVIWKLGRLGRKLYVTQTSHNQMVNNQLHFDVTA